LVEEQKAKADAVKMKCPDCGSDELNLPDNIEKRGERLFMKDTDLQLNILPWIPYICSKCGRNITADELFDYLARYGSQSAVG